MPIDKYITHNFDGLDKVNECVDALHTGECLRGVVKINEHAASEANKVEVLNSQKVFGGV